MQTRDDLQVLMIRLIIFNCGLSQAAEIFELLPLQLRRQIVGMCRLDFMIGKCFCRTVKKFMGRKIRGVVWGLVG